MSINYKDAGVDVEAGYKAVDLMKKHIVSTHDENVLGGVGSFGGMYALNAFHMKEPVLVSGTDGVGTKLKIAFAMDKHDTVGIDCVAMCANDIVCQGAQPLFFLDYIATGKLEPEKAAMIVSGIAEGCRQSGCALIGGETAEMPGFYTEDEYDMAGFCVGVVDKSKLITGQAIEAGDVIVGVPSSGVHSNGFSLVRKLVGDDTASLKVYSEELAKTFGEELLTPTRIYVKLVLDLLKSHTIKGISHITGGGFIENIPRMLPEGCRAVVNTSAYDVPPIFKVLMKIGNMESKSAYNTFNMGMGLVLCVKSEEADAVAKASGGVILGEIKKAEKGIDLL